MVDIGIAVIVTVFVYLILTGRFVLRHEVDAARTVATRQRNRRAGGLGGRRRR